MTHVNAVAISESILRLAASLNRLGTGNADTQMGAMELLAKEVKDGTERIADSIDGLSEAIRDSKKSSL
jgi:hypothetical protein